MADIIAQQEQVKRPANWQAQLAQLVGAGQNPTYGSEFAGQDTLGTKKMKSQEKMHAAEISQKDRAMSMQYKMHAESLALQKWSEEQRWALSWAEFDELKRLNNYKMSGSGVDTSTDFLDDLYGEGNKAPGNTQYWYGTKDPKPSGFSIAGSSPTTQTRLAGFLGTPRTGTSPIVNQAANTSSIGGPAGAFTPLPPANLTMPNFMDQGVRVR